MPTTITVTLDTLGDVLRFWRMMAGKSARELARAASGVLPAKWGVSYMTIIRYEGNQFPATGPDPVVLAAIVTALGHKISELPKDHERRLKAVSDLLVKST